MLGASWSRQGDWCRRGRSYGLGRVSHRQPSCSCRKPIALGLRPKKLMNCLHGQVVRRGLSGALASDEAAPGFVAFVDDLRGVSLVLRLAGERKVVLGLSVGCEKRNANVNKDLDGYMQDQDHVRIL